jgi:hypothetical protein
MNTLFKILVVVCLTCLALGLGDIGNSMVSGLCRAMGAVFFILAFITKMIQKAEASS